MKRMMLIILFPLSLLTAALWAEPHQAHSPTVDRHYITVAETPKTPVTVASEFPALSTLPEDNGLENQEKLVAYAMSLLGTPYIYAGINPDGFDCSGFITHVFKTVGIDVPHSSALQAKEGLGVTREEARVGDVVIFTGTNPAVRTPGHVGIIISTENDTIEFVHSSSVGGVKVSKVEGTGYSRRFLQIRRML